MLSKLLYKFLCSYVSLWCINISIYVKIFWDFFKYFFKCFLVVGYYNGEIDLFFIEYVCI